MFIPNKTFHAIRVSILSVITVLLLVIAVESVLYIQLSQDTNKKLTDLSATLDSISNKTSNKHRVVDNQITDAVTSIREVSTGINVINEQLTTNKRLVQILIDNECKVQPYYMDSRLREFCQ
jgi:hypothetical protein